MVAHLLRDAWRSVVARHCWRNLLSDVERAAPFPPAGATLAVHLRTDGKACTLHYDPGVLAPALVERMARQFIILLRALPTRTEQPIRTLPLLEEVAPMV